MNFNENKAIYLQISELLCEQILTGDRPPQEKIPSVREMGMVLQVNPNTVLRTYDFLQQKNIIFNKRGIGYFVEDDAINRILEYRREDFFANVLPDFLKTIILLKIEPEEIMKSYRKYIQTNSYSLPGQKNKDHDQF
jgi:GntR family transcriptional regulator